jgi:hypothetical protein
MHPAFALRSEMKIPNDMSRRTLLRGAALPETVSQPEDDSGLDPEEPSNSSADSGRPSSTGG